MRYHTCCMASTRLLSDVVCSINISAALSWLRSLSTNDLASARTLSKVQFMPEKIQAIITRTYEGFVRIPTRSQSHISVTPIFQKLQILTIYDVNFTITCIFIYKILLGEGNIPDHFKTYVKVNSDSLILNSSIFTSSSL